MVVKIRSFLVHFVFCVVLASPLFGSLNPQDPSVVFIHIGEEMPIYLETAVKQARLFNSCNIIVVASAKAFRSSSHNLDAYHIVRIPCESLSKTKEHIEFLQTSMLNKTFRNGFWSKATERFFYLQDLMVQFQLKEVFHLENDNMIYVDIATLLPVFQKHYPCIGMTLDNDSRCIPGFVYVRDAESMTHLSQFICTKAIHGLNDMQSLAGYYQMFGAPFAEQLPIIMKSYVEDQQLISPNKLVAKHKFNYCKNEDVFMSIFDAAAIGQYLGGIDSRNSGSQPGFINESCVFNPSLLKFVWKRDVHGRQIPYAQYGQIEYRINNLHVHSKKLQLFLSDRGGA